MKPIDLVQLPHMSALGTFAFAEQLRSCAGALQGKLPPTCAASLGSLTAAQSILAEALRDRLDPSQRPELVALDRTIDTSWAALHDFVIAFTKLPPDHPLAEYAARIYAALFAGGLKFTLIAFTLEWAESDVRLRNMQSPEMAAALDALGAGTFVAAIQAAHLAYGNALGMGAAKKLPPAPAVRPAYLAVLQAIRLYIVKVIASIEPDQPETQALADALLVPLTTWSVPTAKRNAPAAADDSDNNAPEAKAGAGEGPAAGNGKPVSNTPV